MNLFFAQKDIEHCDHQPETYHFIGTAGDFLVLNCIDSFTFQGILRWSSPELPHSLSQESLVRQLQEEENFPPRQLPWKNGTVHVFPDFMNRKADFTHGTFFRNLGSMVIGSVSFFGCKSSLFLNLLGHPSKENPPNTYISRVKTPVIIYKAIYGGYNSTYNC